MIPKGKKYGVIRSDGDSAKTCPHIQVYSWGELRVGYVRSILTHVEEHREIRPFLYSTSLLSLLNRLYKRMTFSGGTKPNQGANCKFRWLYCFQPCDSGHYSSTMN